MPHDVFQPVASVVRVDIAARRALVASWLDERYADRTFKTLRNVELMPLAELRALRTGGSGTMFEAIDGALMENNVKLTGTVGSIMDALALTQANVNYLACYCHNGDTTLGKHTATALRNIG